MAEQVKFKYSGNDSADFAQANKIAGYDKTPEGWTWHHVEDGETMQ